VRELASTKDKHAHRTLRAAQIKQRDRDILRAYPNVIGLGVGLKRVGGRLTEEVAVRVYVSKKVPRDQLAKDSVLPTVIDGVPVDVIQKRSRSFLSVLDHQSRRAVLLGGISVINGRFIGSGTLGCAVYDNFTGQQMILSNWHVLATSLTAGQNERIIQPGYGGGDTGTYADVVARLSRSVLSAELDAAVATLSGHRFCTDELLGLGRVRPSPVGPTLGMAISKSGRTTGVTHGTISDLDADFDVDYSELGLGIRHVEHQLVVEEEGFSAAGDSGSLIVDNQNRPVALLFAGGEGGTDGNPILSVIDALKINFGPSIAPQELIATLISLP
jgi:hypothetical protein